MQMYILVGHLFDEYCVVVVIDHFLVEDMCYQLVGVDDQKVTPNEGEDLLLFESLIELEQDLRVVYHFEVCEVGED